MQNMLELVLTHLPKKKVMLTKYIYRCQKSWHINVIKQSSENSLPGKGIFFAGCLFLSVIFKYLIQNVITFTFGRHYINHLYAIFTVYWKLLLSSFLCDNRQVEEEGPRLGSNVLHENKLRLRITLLSWLSIVGVWLQTVPTRLSVQSSELWDDSLLI